MRTFESRERPSRPWARFDDDDARWMVLHGVFDGDAHAWIDYLLRNGSARQVDEDLPFAINAAIRGSRERAS